MVANRCNWQRIYQKRCQVFLSMFMYEQNIICNKIEVKAVTSHSRYLGLPVSFGKSKKEMFAFVQDRIQKKVKGWKEKYCKETLFRAVALAILSYIMSCYKIREGCCANIEGMLSKF